MSVVAGLVVVAGVEVVAADVVVKVVAADLVMTEAQERHQELAHQQCDAQQGADGYR
jgi:hypothetical protein